MIQILPILSRNQVLQVHLVPQALLIHHRVPPIHRLVPLIRRLVPLIHHRVPLIHHRAPQTRLIPRDLIEETDHK
jgi:hypothetical protein